MSTATTEILAQIHAKLAQKMLAMLDDESCTAREWAVIVKFLKDNNIDAIPSDAKDADDALSKLLAKATESISQYQ